MQSPDISGSVALESPMPVRIFNLKVNRLPAEELVFNHSPAFIAAAAAPLPNKVDLRLKMPYVYDQGQLGSCTANALVAIFQYDAPNFMGSRLFLYYNERVMIGSASYDSGAYLSDGIKSMKATGVCAETLWPYTISKFAIKPPAACYTAALANRVITANNIPNTMAAMKASLVANEPFVVGFLVYASFQSNAVAATGIVPMPRSGERLLGGHAVVVCGYDDSKQWWIVRNSWGNRWGAAGYFYMPYAYLLNPRMASDLWNITSIVKAAAPKVSEKNIVLKGPPTNAHEFMKAIGLRLR
jgi:C1A family cysteine protease